MKIKQSLKKLYLWIKGLFCESFEEAESRRVSRQLNNEEPPYPVCRNCGTTLEGIYCHKCGQRAAAQSSGFKDFIFEYFSNTYPIDTRVFPTIRQLMMRPGHLTQEFMAGKYNSYVNPLKLNLTILFIIITVLVLFSVQEKAESSVVETLNHDIVKVALTLEDISKDKELIAGLSVSERDTLYLLCPETAICHTVEYMSVLEFYGSEEEFVIDTVLVSLPVELIDRGIIRQVEGSLYCVADDSYIAQSAQNLHALTFAWSRLMEIVFKYLTLIILLLSPFLAYFVKLMNLRKYRYYTQCFVFSLHYTAFLELFLFALYFFSSIFSISGSYYMLFFAAAVSVVYVAIANRRVFGDSNVVSSVAKSLAINGIYSLTIFFVFIVIFLVLSVPMFV